MDPVCCECSSISLAAGSIRKFIDVEILPLGQEAEVNVAKHVFMFLYFPGEIRPSDPPIPGGLHPPDLPKVGLRPPGLMIND